MRTPSNAALLVLLALAAGPAAAAPQGDLPEAGQADAPEPIQHAADLIRADKPLSASLALFDARAEYPAHQDQVDYLMGTALADLGMLHAAQHHYLLVVQRGPDSRYFSYALAKAASISRRVGDETDLARAVRGLPPDAFPRAAQGQLRYLLAVDAYADGDLAGAQAHLAQVPGQSPSYRKARYLEGVIANDQGKLKTAVEAFTEIAKAPLPDEPEDRAEAEKLRDLSILNIARIYYGIEQFEKASLVYDKVPRSSPYWAESLFETAWSSYMQDDLNLALGQVLTVHSPFFSADEHLPEADVLQALAFFNFCHYDEVERRLKTFEDRYAPMRDEMRAFVQGYASDEGKRVADQAWLTYFGPGDDHPTAISPALFKRMLRNQDLAGVAGRLKQIEEEKASIAAQKPLWRDTVGDHLAGILEADQHRYERRAGLLLLTEMVQQEAYLSGLISQSELIRFEAGEAQRIWLEDAARGNVLPPDVAAPNIPYATAEGLIYWPFNGEFWEDELGYYRYTEQGLCSSSLP